MNKYDFSKVPSRKLITPGIYEAAVVDVKLGESRKGEPQKQVVFELLNGDMISDFLVETENVLWKIQSLFRACELPHEGKVTMSDEWREVKGVKLQIKIETQEYKGQNNSRVVGYYPMTPEPEEPESEQTA